MFAGEVELVGEVDVSSAVEGHGGDILCRDGIASISDGVREPKVEDLSQEGDRELSFVSDSSSFTTEGNSRNIVSVGVDLNVVVVDRNIWDGSLLGSVESGELHSEEVGGDWDLAALGATSIRSSFHVWMRWWCRGGSEEKDGGNEVSVGAMACTEAVMRWSKSEIVIVATHQAKSWT